MGRDVSSRYRRRNRREYERIADYILTASGITKGNYLVFFPSYAYLEEVYQVLKEREPEADLFVQSSHMREAERETFLGAFSENREQSLIGLCVMGGIFSEGIDLTGEKLIGVMVVGTGLSQICTEREMLRGWYEAHGKDGFAYAYRYPGMNRVLQAAGRVIRTDTDEGVILLLDDRFLTDEYRGLFPREWSDCQVIEYEGLEEAVGTFWKNREIYLQIPTNMV